MTPVDAGDEQKAHLVDKASLKKGPVDMAAAFEQQLANSKVLAQQVHCFPKDNRGRSGNNVGDALVAEHGKIILRRPLTHDTDEVIAVEIATRPTAACQWYRPRSHTTSPGARRGPTAVLRAGSKPTRRVHPPRSSVHRGAAAEPGVAFEFRARCLIVPLGSNCPEGCAIDLPLQGRRAYGS